MVYPSAISLLKFTNRGFFAAFVGRVARGRAGQCQCFAAVCCPWMPRWIHVGFPKLPRSDRSTCIQRIGQFWAGHVGDQKKHIPIVWASTFLCKCFLERARVDLADHWMGYIALLIMNFLKGNAAKRSACTTTNVLFSHFILVGLEQR